MISRKSIYLGLALIGLFVKFLDANRFDMQLLVQQLFANNITTFFAIEFIISIMVFWIYLIAEANKLQLKSSSLCVLASLTEGLSFALPLFLFFRERELENK